MEQFNEDTKDPDEIFVTFTFKKNKKQLYIDVNKYAPLREALYILTDKYEWLKNIPAMGASLKEKPFSTSDLDKPLYTLGIDESSDICILTDQKVDLFAAAKTLVKQKKQNQQINNPNFNQLNSFPNVNNFNNFQMNQFQFNQNQGFINFNMQKPQNNVNMNNQNMNMNNMQNNVQNPPFYNSTRLKEIYTFLKEKGFCSNQNENQQLINFLNELFKTNYNGQLYCTYIPVSRNDRAWQQFKRLTSNNRSFFEAAYRILKLFPHNKVPNEVIIDIGNYLSKVTNGRFMTYVEQNHDYQSVANNNFNNQFNNNRPVIPLNNNKNRQPECFIKPNNKMMINNNMNKMNQNNMVNQNKMNQNMNQNNQQINQNNNMNNMQNNVPNQPFSKSDKLCAIFNYLTSNGFCLPNYKDRDQLINFLNNLYTKRIYKHIPTDIQNQAAWNAFKNVKHNNRHYLEAVYRISYLFPQIKDENTLQEFLKCAQINSQTFINYGDLRRNKQNNQNMNVNNMQNNVQNNNFNNQLMNGFLGGDWLALDSRPIETLMQTAGINCDKTALFNQICKVIDSIDLNLQQSKDPQEMAEWQRNYCLAMEFLKRYYSQEIGQWYPYHEYPLFFNMYDCSQRFVPTYRDPQTNKWVLGRITFYNPVIGKFETITEQEYKNLRPLPKFTKNKGCTCYLDAARNSILHNRYTKAILNRIGQSLSVAKQLGVESYPNGITLGEIKKLNDFELLAVFAYASEWAYNNPNNPNCNQLCEEIINIYFDKLEEANPLFKRRVSGDIKDYYNYVSEQLRQKIHRGINLQSNNIQPVQENPYITYNNFTNTIATQETSLLCEPKGTKTCCNDCNNVKYNFELFAFLESPMHEVKKYTNNRNFSFNNNILYTLDDCLWYDQKTDLLTGENMMWCNSCNRLCNASYGNLRTNPCNLPHLIFNHGQGLQFGERIYLDQYYKTPDGDYLQLVSFEIYVPQHFMSLHKVFDGQQYQWYLFNDTDNEAKIVDNKVIDQLLHYQYQGTLGHGVSKCYAPFTVRAADYQPIARQNAKDITFRYNVFGQPQENVPTLFGLGQTKCTKLYNPLYNVFYDQRKNNFGEPNQNNPYTAVLGLQKLLMNLGLGKLVNKQMIQDVENLYKNWNNTHYCAGYNNNLYPVQQVNNIFINPKMFPNNNVNLNMNNWKGKNNPQVFK